MDLIRVGILPGKYQERDRGEMAYYNEARERFCRGMWKSELGKEGARHKQGKEGEG